MEQRRNQFDNVKGSSKPGRLGYILWSVLFLAWIIVVTGCEMVRGESGTKPSQESESKVRVETVELVVSAASSLQTSLEQLKPMFEAEHPEIKLLFNYGASGSLQKQIEQGAPVDLFISAGQRQLDELVNGGLISAEQSGVLLYNKLVLIVPKTAAWIEGGDEGQHEKNDEGYIGRQALEQLIKGEIRTIALGEPKVVPAGTYAYALLREYGLWDELYEKLVYAKDVSQVLTYVESGNVDAGFVYESDVLASDQVKTVSEWQYPGGQAIAYPTGIIRDTRYMEQAELFYHFLHSSQAKDVFIQNGFTVPE